MLLESKSCFSWRQKSQEPPRPLCPQWEPWCSAGRTRKGPATAPGGLSTLWSCSHLLILAWPPVTTSSNQAGLQTCLHAPTPAPSGPRHSLSSDCVITALVSGSPQPMKSAKDLQGTLLHNTPLLFVFPPAFYRIVGFLGALNPPHNEF